MRNSRRIPDSNRRLLRIFEVEGVSDVSLAAVDKYTHKDRTWSKRLLGLTQRGVYSRELLIDKTLSALERGWIQFRSGWFSQFHEALAPTIEEMKPTPSVTWRCSRAAFHLPSLSRSAW